MITSIECPCGNQDTNKAVEYDGVSGYEAIICTCCGRYCDHTGEHEADDWSKTYVKTEEIVTKHTID